MVAIKNTRTQTITWVNEHGTFKKTGVTRILPIASPGDELSRWRRVGEVFQDVVAHAFKTNQPLRADGSRWSLSKIGAPTQLALSMAAHDVLHEVPPEWLSGAYQTDLAAMQLTPMLISGSMKIGRINRALTLSDLALQTSGASDGQTLAGATTTGTHGAAIKLGAIHDTFRAIHLMVGPKEAVLVQPSKQPLTQAAATQLTSWLGFQTKLVSDDAAFEAAIVGLGSMGLVLNVVVEVEPLYFLTNITTAHVDDRWKKVLSTMSPAGIAGHPAQPWHLEVLLLPYAQKPKTAPRAWVKTMSKTLYKNQPGVEIDTSHPTRPSPDLIGFISKLASVADATVLNGVFRAQITKEMVARYGAKKSVRMALPGVMFGPTALPKGQGHSVEFVVSAHEALPAVEAILAALGSELKHGRQFLGGIGVRFVGGSRGILAPNKKSPSCFIELPGIRTQESTKIYDACGKALTAAGIDYGCHWGQYLTGTKASLKSYWSPGETASWIAARQLLLPSAQARAIFQSMILKAAGLE
jgi:hypothetical protein